MLGHQDMFVYNGDCRFYLLGNLPCRNWKQGHAVQKGRHAIAGAVVCLTWSDGEVNTEMRTKWRENGWMEMDGWPEKLSMNPDERKAAKKSTRAQGRDHVIQQNRYGLFSSGEKMHCKGQTMCHSGWQVRYGSEWQAERNTNIDWGVSWWEMVQDRVQGGGDEGEDEEEGEGIWHLLELTAGVGVPA